MRSVKKIHQSIYSPIADLKTYRPLPNASLKQIDPFIFLNHHGPQVYAANNNGLPFGPHPHRGMETVTFIVDGEIMHKDTGGHESIIKAGGVQWMTAGSGLIHAEVSSDEFKKNGGALEILQLWLNLPSKYKMVKPRYEGFQKEQIPAIKFNDGNVELNLISGSLNDYKGVVNSLSDIMLSTIKLQKEAQFSLSVPVEHNIFLYVIHGKMNVNNRAANAFQLVEFNNDAEEILIHSEENSLIIFGHAKPLGEPMIAQGPFVMNTEAEIHKAYEDYRMGKFGKWGY